MTRRANKAAPDQGGWNIFCTDWSGFDMMNPVVEQVLRCGGVQTGFFGWPDLPRIEALREAWLEASDEDGRKTIARDLQVLAMQEVPYLPLGQYLSRTAYRNDLQDVVKNLSVFWNVRRAS